MFCPPAVRKASCHPLSSAAATPSPRDSVSRFSPCSNSSTAAALRCLGLLPLRMHEFRSGYLRGTHTPAAPGAAPPNSGGRFARRRLAPSHPVHRSSCISPGGDRPLARCPNQSWAEGGRSIAVLHPANISCNTGFVENAQSVVAASLPWYPPRYAAFIAPSSSRFPHSSSPCRSSE